MALSARKLSKKLLTDALIALSESGVPSRDRFVANHGEKAKQDLLFHFGTFTEALRAAGLKNTRAAQKSINLTARNAAVDDRLDFVKSEVFKYSNAFEKKRKGRYVTIAVFSDLHDMDVDPFVFGVFLDMCARRNPNIVIGNGDIYDMPEFSTFRKDSRKMRAGERVRFVHENVWRKVRNVLPDAQIDFLAGNHEDRFLKSIGDKNPYAIEVMNAFGGNMASMLGLRDFEINLVASKDLNEWKHDNQNAKSFKIYEGCFVAAHEKNYGFGLSGTSGHTHRAAFETSWNFPMKSISWTTSGCMCIPDADFVDGPSDWTQGFAYFTIDTLTKSVFPENFVCFGDHMVIDGELYARKLSK